MEQNINGKAKIIKKDYQKLANHQGRSITGIFTSAPVGIVIKETGLRTSESLLSNNHRRYAQLPLALPTHNGIRKILSDTLFDGDAHTQSGRLE